MIKLNNKERVIEEINENKLENIFNIIPNLSDKVLDYNEKNYNIIEMIKDTFEDQRIYNSEIPTALFLLSGIQSRMKQQFSISELPLALTSKEIINKMNLNVAYEEKEGLLKESNIRAWLSKYKEEKLEFNNYFIKYFNKLTHKYLEKANIKSNIHTLDCSILDVNYNNENYEGSTITIKGGENLRGYKIGLLRGVTPNGGVIEEVCMSTAKEHDVLMSKDMILNSPYLKQGDYLLEDRGFLDIEIFKKLNKKEIKIIIPVKKNMEIYKAAVETAIQNNNWTIHPNKKRKGQEISLIPDMEYNWLSDNDKYKKPERLELDYKINCCVIRFEKDKNKDVLTDVEIINSDDKYAYACIITNDTNLSETEIIKLYEMRTEIEEDFRQLKDFWGLNIYRSTNYNIISFIILVSLIGYNFYKVYVESEEGNKYIGKSLIVEEKHGLYIVKGVRTAIVTEHYFGIFEQDELLDIYADLSKEKRQLLKKYLVA